MRTVRQDDFSAGVVDIDRANVPPNAVFDAKEVILDGEAALRRRGATRSYGSDRADLVWVWHGMLTGGRRTVMWDATAGFCVLADDSNGLPGSTVASTAYGSGFHGITASAITSPPAHAVLGGILFVAPRAVYAGSRKAAAYSGASTAFTLGSATVTKAAGGFTANVDAGMLVSLSGGRYYVVKSVESDTSLTLTETFVEATVTATATFTPVGDFTTMPHAGPPVSTLPTFSAVAAVANRLVIVPVTGYVGQVVFSAAAHPDTGAIRWYSFNPGGGDRHELPAGAEIKALANLRDRCFAFTTEGVYTISNMAYEVVDFAGNPQHRVELYTKDVRALSQASIVTWRDALVVPGFDDIVLLDGASAPVAISQGCRRQWREAVAAAVPGQPVLFLNHLVLPVSGVLWLFKLDAPVPDDDGPIFPMVKWGEVGGAIGGTSALALRPVASASLAGGARVLAANANLTGIFDLLVCFLGEGALGSFATVKFDHASAGTSDSYAAYVITRDFALGDAREGLLRRVQAWYTLEGLDTSAGYNIDTGNSAYPDGLQMGAIVGGARDAGTAVLADSAGGTSAGRSPKGWDLQLQGERVRVAILLGNDCSEFVLHGVQLSFRESQRAY